MGYMMWLPYVPVAVRRAKAQKKLAEMKKNGHLVSPVTIAGRTIAASFWGKSWCANLERYSDFANRLPRGRTYVRNGSVLDLQIAKGKVTALVNGSELYRIMIAIAAVEPRHWKSICRHCTGSIDSLVELLGGRLAKGVMDRVCRKGDGLFPAPKEIKLSCSCPDWAEMCKHVAAALYGVGARLDEKPELLFALRGVDASDLLAAAGEHVPLAKKASRAAKVLDESDIGSVFGIEMAAPSDTSHTNGKAPAPPKQTRHRRLGRKSKTAAGKFIVPPKRSSRAKQVTPPPRRRSTQPILDR
ncbi:MAG: SWIM zinc finger family protein [Rhizomicrobium sp.]